MLSFAMMLRYSFDLKDEAELVEKAVNNALTSGVRTGDIMQPGMKRVSTSEMGNAVLVELAKLV